MGAAETIELALEISNRMDVHWGLFITVHMALLGALWYLDGPLHPAEKALAIAVYLGFAVTNLAMMSGQLLMLDAAYNDVARLAADGIDSELATFMADLQARDRHATLWVALRVSHVLMAVIVVGTFVFHPLRGRNAPPEAEKA